MKTLDNFKVVYETGEQFDMDADLSVLVRSLDIEPPKMNFYTEKIEGRDGSIRLGRDIGSRNITANCSFFGVDYTDHILLRDKLISVLISQDYFYIITDAEPAKRWKVYVADEWKPIKIGSYGEFSIVFTCDIPYAESIGTTLDPLTFDAELWGIGEGLMEDQTVFEFTASTFSLYNSGDIPVNPRIYPSVITFTGASTNLKITNNTTGDVWQYTGTTTASDSVVIDGIRSTKNALSIFRSTNHRVISVNTGWNDFTITGASGSFDIKFEFRFYYL